MHYKGWISSTAEALSLYKPIRDSQELAELAMPLHKTCSLPNSGRQGLLASGQNDGRGVSRDHDSAQLPQVRHQLSQALAHQAGHGLLQDRGPQGGGGTA